MSHVPIEPSVYREKGPEYSLRRTVTVSVIPNEENTVVTFQSFRMPTIVFLVNFEKDCHEIPLSFGVSTLSIPV